MEKDEVLKLLPIEIYADKDCIMEGSNNGVFHVVFTHPVMDIFGKRYVGLFMCPGCTYYHREFMQIQGHMAKNIKLPHRIKQQHKGYSADQVLKKMSEVNTGKVNTRVCPLSIGLV